MIPRNEALELIEGLERASRRTRPFLIWGLIAIIAGFVTLSVYLKILTDRAMAEKAAAVQRADVLDARLKQITTTLRQAYGLADDRRIDPAAQEHLRTLLGLAATQTLSLETAVAETRPEPQAGPQPSTNEKALPPPAAVENAATPSPQADSVPATIRLVIHISDPSQAPAVAQMRLILTGARLGDLPISTEVRRVDHGADNSLRCLKRADCQRADQLLAIVNGRLRSPLIHGRDFSRYYERARNVRPGTYELWFAPGQIELQPIG